MLTIKENFLETIRGGTPDRFVKQFEYMELIGDPITAECGDDCPEGTQYTNRWGVTSMWPKGMPGPIPRQDGDYLLLKDISQWKRVVTAPDLGKYSDADWAPYIAKANAVDRSEKYAAVIMGGLFERMHAMMGMENAMMAFYEDPDAAHELLDCFLNWELEVIRLQAKYLHPDMIFHHDDWGSQTTLFFTPAMFEEFIFPVYQKIYHCWRENGVEIVVHHSDSYAAELVPYMIRMGVDVFQGAVSTNNIPALLDQFGGQIAIHAGLDNGAFDKADWSGAAIDAALEKLIADTHGGRYLIPGLTMGGEGSSYPGVYEYTNQAIDRLSKKYFG